MTRTTSMAVAADYADALMTARRAKNMLFLALAFLLVAQLAVFFLVRFRVITLADRAGITPAVVPAAVTPAPTPAPAAAPTSGPSTEPSADGSTTPAAPAAPAAPVAAADGTSGGTGSATPPATKPRTATVDQILGYAVPVINFLGVTLGVVLSIVLLLLTAIMLVGRLIGVSHVTSAFIWSVVLLAFVFPWQAFLISSERYPVAPASAHDEAYPEQPAFKFPGALYTYPELRQDLQTPGTFEFNGNVPRAVVKWARYAAFPLAALLILLAVQVKSGRGLRFALGEADIQVDMAGAGPQM